MIENIEEIRKKLETEPLKVNEVFHDIVISLLGDLCWPINTRFVRPAESELGTQSRSTLFSQIDDRHNVLTEFVLRHPSVKGALVYFKLVEGGGIKRAERQLLENVSQEERLISILTDGEQWHFFHPDREWNYRARRVRELNLLKGDSEENAKYLNRYLSYKSVCNGEARQAIEEDYRELVARNLPKAWKNLLAEKNESLLHAMMEKMESLYGYKPTMEQLFDFLECLKIDKPSPEPIIIRKPPIETRPSTPPSVKSPSTHLSVKMENGEVIRRKHAANTYVDVIEKLGIERILALGLDLLKVRSTLPPDLQRYKQSGQYYIRMPGDTKRKKKSLEEIAKEVGVRLEIEIIEK